jgi:acyl carrier protein
MHDRGLVTARLTRVFRETFDDNSIELRNETTAKDIMEWDSLTHIILVLAVEQEFGVSLNAAEIGSLENVGRMLDLLMVKATR